MMLELTISVILLASNPGLQVSAQQAPSKDVLTPEERYFVNVQAPEPRLDPEAKIPALEQRDMAIRNILDRIATESGIVLRYDPDLAGLSKPSEVKLAAMSVDDALRTVLDAHGMAFRATGRKSAVVFANSPEKHRQFTTELRTFVIVKADLTALMTRLNRLMTPDALGIRAVCVWGKESRTITVRALPAKMAEMAKLIADLDK